MLAHPRTPPPDLPEAASAANDRTLLRPEHQSYLHLAILIRRQLVRYVLREDRGFDELHCCRLRQARNGGNLTYTSLTPWR